MTKLVNRAKMTTATTGTGTISLSGAVDGYQTFADAGVVNSDVVRYVIEDGNNWEIGTGVYTASGTTLSRTVSESSNADAAINLSGEAVVYVTAAAADLQELVDFADNFVLPTSDGSTGQVLTTNGSGTLSFSTISGGATDINGLSDGKSDGYSVGLGVNAIQYDDGTINYNVGVGYEALRGNSVSNLTGINNVGIGYQTGLNLSSGIRNVAIGDSALWQATTGGYNIAIGYQAMNQGVATFSSGNNVVLGRQAGYQITTGYDNVLSGYRSGFNITSGYQNVAHGRRSLYYSTTGISNIAIGNDACLSLTTGANNVALGNGALDAATTISGTVAIGQNALGSVVSTSNNVAIGVSSQSGLTGQRNTSLGAYSLGFNSGGGEDNVAIGAYAGAGVGSGSDNVYVGKSAGNWSVVHSTGSNCIVIGNEADASAFDVSNEITLGNSSIATLRCQVTTITSLSDARDKTDIQPLNAGLDFVNALEPVSFTWNMRDGGKVGEADTGFIAQDLKRVQEETGVTIPHLVFEASPERLEAGYGKLIPVLVQAIKELSAKVDELEARLEEK